MTLSPPVHMESGKMWKVGIQEELLACLPACLLAQVTQLICVMHFHCNLPRFVHKLDFVCLVVWLTCLFLCFALIHLACLAASLFVWLFAGTAARVLTGLLCCLDVLLLGCWSVRYIVGFLDFYLFKFPFLSWLVYVEIPSCFG